VKNFLFLYKFAVPSILLLTPALSLLRLLPLFCVITPINWASSQTWLSKFRSQNFWQNFLQSHWRQILFRLKHVTHLNHISFLTK